MKQFLNKSRPLSSIMNCWSNVVKCAVGLILCLNQTTDVFSQAIHIKTGTNEPVVVIKDIPLPSGQTFSYAYYQQIIQKEEFLNAGGKAGQISSLQMQFPNLGDVATYGDWDVWIGHTTKERFNNGATSDWVSSGLTKVFSGNIHTLSNELVAGSWFEIPFSEAEFTYNGTDNLVIAIHEKTAGDDQLGWSILSYTTRASTSDPDYSTPISTQNRGRMLATSTAAAITPDNLSNATMAQSASIDTVFQVRFVQPIQIKHFKSGDVAMSFAPPNGFIKDYFLYQQIVRADEFADGGGEAGQIEKIRFFVENVGSNPNAMAEWDIWIGQTTKARYDYVLPLPQCQGKTAAQCVASGKKSASDWISLQDMQLVFSGNIFDGSAQKGKVSVTPANNRWMQIDFEQPFNYNGSDNIVIAIHEKSAGTNSGWSFRGYNWTSSSTDANYARARVRLHTTNRTSGNDGDQDYAIDTLNLPPYSDRLNNANEPMLQMQFIGKNINCTGITIQGDDEVCQNGTIQLSLSNGRSTNLGTWSSADDAIATVNNLRQKGKVTAKTTNSSVAINFKPLGCSNTISKTITVKSGTLPSAGTFANLPAMCVGDEVEVSNGGNDVIEWISDRPSNVVVEPTIGGVKIKALNRRTGTTNILYVVQDGISGCTAEGSFTVGAINDAAIVNIVPTQQNENTICVGETMELNVGGNVTSYTWSGGELNGTETGGVQTVTPAISPKTTYTVVGTTTQGCNGTATIEINVKPTLSTPIFGTETFCSDALPTSFPSTGGVLGHWEDASNATVTAPTTAQVYTFVANAGQCGNPGNGTWTVTATPALVTPTFGSETFCADALPTSFPSTDGVLGHWEDASNATVTAPTTAQVYTFVADGGQCGNPGNGTWTVTATTALATPTFGTEIVCGNDPLPTSFPSTDGVLGHWEDASNATVTAPTTTAQVYTFVANTGQCGNPGNGTWTVTSGTVPPTPALNGKTEVCVGDTIHITIQSTDTGGQWSRNNDNATNQSNIVTGVIPGTTTFSYVVTVGGCTSEPGTYSVLVKEKPSAGTLSPSTNTICKESTVNLSVSGNSATGTWNTSNINIASVNNGTVKGESSGSAVISYTVTENGCTDVATANVSVSSPFVINIIGPDTIQTGTSAIYSTGLPAIGTWTSNNKLIADFDEFNTSELIATGSGIVTIIYTVKNNPPCTGEVSKSKDIFVAPIPFSGISDIDAVSAVSLFPNPATDEINVYFTLNNSTDVSVEIIDLNGRVIESHLLNNTTSGFNSTILNVSNYANGVYSLLIRANNSLMTQKLVISK